MAGTQSTSGSLPDVCGRRIWTARASVSSSSSSSDGLSDITVYSHPPNLSESIPAAQLCPPQANDMVGMAEAIIRQSGQRSEAVVVAVGSETQIKSYVTKSRRHARGATKFRSAIIRELSALVITSPS